MRIAPQLLAEMDGSVDGHGSSDPSSHHEQDPLSVPRSSTRAAAQRLGRKSEEKFRDALAMFSSKKEKPEQDGKSNSGPNSEGGSQTATYRSTTFEESDGRAYSPGSSVTQSPRGSMSLGRIASSTGYSGGSQGGAGGTAHGGAGSGSDNGRSAFGGSKSPNIPSSNSVPPPGMTVRRAGGWRGGAAHASAGARISQNPSQQSSSVSSLPIGAGAPAGAGSPAAAGAGPSAAPGALSHPWGDMMQLSSLPMMDTPTAGGWDGASNGSGQASSKKGPASLSGWDLSEKMTRTQTASPPGLIAQLPPLTPYPPTPDGTGPSRTQADPIGPDTTPMSGDGGGDESGRLSPMSKAELAENPTDLPFGAGQEGQYDWANFVFAYSRGRWDPLRLPRPPGLSTLYPGTSTRISLTDEGSLDKLANPAARRLSLEYSSSEDGSSEDFVPMLSTKAKRRTAKTETGKESLVDPVRRGSEPPQHFTGPRTGPSQPSQPLAAPMSRSSISEPRVSKSKEERAATGVARPADPLRNAAMDHFFPSGVESAPNAPTLASIEAAERKLKEKEKGQLHSHTSPNPVMHDIPADLQLLPSPIQALEKDGRAAVVADRSGPESVGSQSGETLQEKDLRSESRMLRGVNQSAPEGLKFGEGKPEKDAGQAEEQESTPSRPQPTPIQAGGTSYSEPAYGWDVLPEGTTSTMAHAMIRKASETLETSSFLAPDGIGEGNTLDDLRRAARRASFDRQVAKLPLKNPQTKLPPHSLSFPLDASKAFGKPMTGPEGVLSITEAKLGSSTITAGSWMGGKSPETVQPTRQEPPSFLRSTAGEALQKESALRGHMAGDHETPNGDWRMTEAEEIRTDPSVKIGSPKPANRKRRSSVDDSKSTPMTASANIGEGPSPITNHVHAGKQTEKFYGEHGYLPAVYPPNELDRRKALRRYGPPMLTGNANFDRIAHLVKLVFNTKLVLISFVGEKEQVFRSEAGAAATTLEQMNKSRDCSFCGHAILQEGDEPVVVLDATKDWRFAGNPLVLGLPSIRFYAGSPLRTADGFNIGSLCIIDDRPREEFNPRQRHTLREFARIVMREMELLRDRMHFNARDRMQHSIENFTRECLEMDMEDSTDGQVQDAHGARRIYGLAAENMREALQANGAVVFDLSHFELIESFPPDSEDSSTKIFFPSPYSQPDLKPFASAERPDQVDVVDSPFWDRSNKDVALKSKLVPPMVVLGASEESDPPRQRADPVPLSHHVQVAQFLRAHPAGRFYPYTPTPLRHLLPEGISRLLVVPIFGLNRQPFALLCSYSTSSEEGGTLEELKDTGLQYLRAVGMIVLSAVLRKDIMLADKAKSHFISK